MSVWSWWKRKTSPKPRKLRSCVVQHLGVDVAEVESVIHEIKPVQRINIQRVLDRWMLQAEPQAKAFGFSSLGYFSDREGLVRYLVTDELIQAALERVQLESGPEETLDCVLRGLFLFHRQGAPVLVALRPSNSYRHDLPILEVIAPTREGARTTLSALLEEAHREDVYRGKFLTVEQSGTWDEGILIRFQEVRSTRREDIVLPAELIQVVERNVFGMLRHAEVLRGAGRSLRRGLLFHGPPGTGKTLMVRYLAQACENHTVILLTGEQQGLIREVCQLARMLAPSIVVLEDVDLVAEDREHNRCPVMLHALMNEMDGLGSRDEIMFLLTTNRPEFLEAALSARPGRIDQAIAFPLPDEGCRRRLFELYGQGLDLSAVDLEQWVAQTNGVSPAFIEELLRKATLLAAERGETGQPMKVTDTDIDEAIRELVYFGGELTQKLLGYRVGRMGYQSA